MAGIYLHIPFCKKRCLYCDFFSTLDTAQIERYCHALCRELVLRKSYLHGEAVSTIYLGGGTPSQLPIHCLREIFDTISTHFTLLPHPEITIEANPDDLTPLYVDGLRTLPLNRVSMGVQSFHDPMLSFLGRRHTAAQAMEAVKRCYEAGYDNVSIDLMFSLPGQTMESWEQDLDQALSLGVQHLSAYNLSYEEGTRLTKLLNDGKIEAVDEETSLALYGRLIDRVTAAGYRHYEISNFALPGRESRHNSSYWEGIPYLGVGAAAHSYDGTSRGWNMASLSRYMQGIEEGTPCFEREELDATERYNDAIITRLRTARGLQLSWVQEQFGAARLQECVAGAQPFIDRGLVENDGSFLRLTRQGIFVSDCIFRELIVV